MKFGNADGIFLSIVGWLKRLCNILSLKMDVTLYRLGQIVNYYFT
jgi:hypothetical protein